MKPEDDGIHPLERLERIAIALESIAGNLEKIANKPIQLPPMALNTNPGHWKF